MEISCGVLHHGGAVILVPFKVKTLFRYKLIFVVVGQHDLLSPLCTQSHSTVLSFNPSHHHHHHPSPQRLYFYIMKL